MDIGIIARRYARALLLFACENGHETLVYEQAQQLLFQYNQLPEFRHTIENPMVSRTEKIKLLHNATAGADTCEELTKFFYLLLEKRREKLLAFILHSFLFLYRKKKKIRATPSLTCNTAPTSSNWMDVLIPLSCWSNTSETSLGLILSGIFLFPFHYTILLFFSMNCFFTHFNCPAMLASIRQ